MWIRLPLSLVAVNLLLVGAAGCSDGRPSRVPIAGRVLIDGQPLKYGTVRFVPEHDRMSGAQLDSEGRFQLSCFEKGDGAVRGLHRITVSAAEPVAGSKLLWHAPKKYSDIATSDLTKEIDAPNDDLVINLTWDGDKPFYETVEEEK